MLLYATFVAVILTLTLSPLQAEPITPGLPLPDLAQILQVQEAPSEEPDELRLIFGPDGIWEAYSIVTFEKRSRKFRPILRITMDPSSLADITEMDDNPAALKEASNRLQTIKSQQLLAMPSAASDVRTTVTAPAAKVLARKGNYYLALFPEAASRVQGPARYFQGRSYQAGWVHLP